MTLNEIASTLRDSDARITLVYAFNATGKTQLCVAYKNATKQADGTHSGVYYNAYSEDLFVWNNDEDNEGANIRLSVLPSSLSRFHTLLTEDNIRDKLRAYKPKFGFTLNLYRDDPEKGIESVEFFIPNQNPDMPQKPIKISRGEERIFVWCLFLALFEVEGWADKQASHFFIDDPVSSLDDNNIFVTAATLFDLVESKFDERKIIITTHHLGLFSILSDWLTKGEQQEKFRKNGKPLYKLNTLTSKSGQLELENCRKDVFLYHLRMLQMLTAARNSNEVGAYHFALLRQVLENVASFLGVGQFGYVLSQIGINEPSRAADIINALSHKKVYYYESNFVVEDNLGIFNEVMDGLLAKYSFVLHEAGA
ncbi:AAA family ATPase [Xanthomonas campestris pv. campestris]|uniref:AAA family ATPase n=1 Tax=Xanthomonas campestris TaxID=339 RepID=UPI00094AFE1A|nr:AAA family ATPase [Xanthomonas campestris]MDO0863503.1 AAA family ATPase [Xanthomonas campestris pv. campestris]MEA0682475.1 AAA family ATPase [Xanthomonas campestris pv. campestris]MEA0698326.1 AAA family ATPase [Xanthomonas campestris pv. campestris]MEA0777291.1 AAA family ATPase [Xanthomonas campestris pv. campestris]MEA0785481.1 AAA family ATPase [Xanthomonas campestris pv. campestris]